MAEKTLLRSEKARIYFVIEPDENLRKRFLLGWMASLAVKEGARKFLFEKRDDPGMDISEMPFINARKYYFAPAGRETIYGTRFLEWTRAIKDWKEKAIFCGVDAFDDLMQDFDSQPLVCCRRDAKPFSQSNAEQFAELTSDKHTARVTYLFGVADFAWLVAFLGFGELRAQGSFLTKDLFGFRTETRQTTVPSDRCREFLNETGIFQLRYSKSFSLIFLSENGLKMTRTRLFKNLTAPARKIKFDKTGFVQLSTFPLVWKSASFSEVGEL